MARIRRVRRQRETSALRHMVSSFFEGSPAKAVAALLADSKLNPEEIERLAQLVEKARNKEGAK